MGNNILPEGPAAPNGRGSEPSHIRYQPPPPGIYTHVPITRDLPRTYEVGTFTHTLPHALVDTTGNPYTIVI